MDNVRVGLVGTGRLGALYAEYLANRVEGCTLIAIAGHRAAELAMKYPVQHHSEDRLELIRNPYVDAVVICSSTDTHVNFVGECFAQKKPVFCEKPLSLSYHDALRLQDMQTSYFQAGFMRRFDPAYQEAQHQMVSGQLGQPRFFRATSRDKERTSLEYATNSGGLIMDMAVHDLDLARYFMGDAEVVDVIGGRLFYPELESIPDIDTAIITLQFKSGALGVIDVSRRAAYGYDIATEIVGFRGAIRVDSLKRTATTVLTNNAVTHDTYPSFMERFETAFIRQLQNFVTNLIVNVPSPVTLEDAIAALKLGYDATYKLRVL